jgi:SAM-dependent methyltransferase
MFSESAELYDLIYSEFKDFAAEGRKVGGMILEMAPGARTVLDVGCGTGRHAEVLNKEFGLDVDGLDIHPGFLDIASKRCPSGAFHLEDMADFELDRRYDVVICLFSSIGYVRTEERLRSTARSFSRHLAPGGLAIVEPWFSPDRFSPGTVYLNTVERENLKIARMSTSEVVGEISRLDFQYLVGDGDGVRHLREVHELGLFSERQMKEAFEKAGFGRVELDPVGLTDRGLYLARGLLDRRRADTLDG